MVISAAENKSGKRARQLLCLITQLCPTLCDPLDCSLPGSLVCGTFLGKNSGVGCHILHILLHIVSCIICLAGGFYTH